MLNSFAASALKCYSCTGFTCGYGLLSFTYPEVECEARTGISVLDAVASIVPTQCVKIVGKDEQGNGFVARNCTPYSGQVACNLIAGALEIGSGHKDLECYTCTDNLCNSATQFTGMAVVGLIIACFAFLL
ncbi:hypothetical protein PPYR_13859 [Photinus pyralis]|uniref:Uncharacterized protein n=1 Tax=Photinus pyralis TaxID=7054 RepID=A0A5N4AAD0_PHOPY|nr:uncharacterized protein LOC116179371 [Photinus pyralis]KAB0794239.1 hypothetical protein PPYR_13859 [Photinus pyralis]